MEWERMNTGMFASFSSLFGEEVIEMQVKEPVVWINLASLAKKAVPVGRWASLTRLLAQFKQIYGNSPIVGLKAVGGSLKSLMRETRPNSQISRGPPATNQNGALDIGTLFPDRISYNFGSTPAKKPTLSALREIPSHSLHYPLF